MKYELEDKPKKRNSIIKVVDVMMLVQTLQIKINGDQIAKPIKRVFIL